MAKIGWVMIGLVAVIATTGSQTLAQTMPGPGRASASGMMDFGGAPPGVMMMGSGGMQGQGMMMGPGGMPGRAMMGAAPGGQADLKLSARDATSYLDRLIAMMANPRLKAGPVVEKDADTITVDIVTVDKGGLAQRLKIDRHTGAIRPAAD